MISVPTLATLKWVSIFSYKGDGRIILLCSASVGLVHNFRNEAGKLEMIPWHTQLMPFGMDQLKTASLFATL